MHPSVDNLRRRGAVIAGFGTCCSEAKSSCVATPQNYRLPEHFGRSGTRVKVIAVIHDVFVPHHRIYVLSAPFE